MFTLYGHRLVEPILGQYVLHVPLSSHINPLDHLVFLMFLSHIRKWCFQLADLVVGGGVTSVATPLSYFEKKREKNKAKNRRQSSWKRREKELHICLVFMCTRVDTCINKHFSFKFFLLKPPFEKIMDPRLSLISWSIYLLSKATYMIYHTRCGMVRFTISYRIYGSPFRTYQHFFLKFVITNFWIYYNKFLELAITNFRIR